MSYRKIFIFILCLFSLLSFASSRNDVISKIEVLNPGIAKEKIHYKISSVDSPFLFFRSFVALYFDTLKNLETYAEIEELHSYKVRGPVDYHPDNYSFYPSQNGQLIYQMNDYDSANIIPAVSEFIRYLSSLKISLFESVDELEIKDYFNAYKKGLNGESFDIPNFLVEKIQGQKNYYKPSGKDFKNGRLNRDLKKKRIALELNSNEKESIAHIAPWGVKVIDAFKFYNVTGGSGGLLRYKILLDFGQDGPLEGEQVFELKEIDKEAFNPLSEVDNFSPVEILKTLVDNDEFVHFYKIKEIAGKSYLLRPKFDGLDHDEFLEYSNKKRQKIASLQMNIMGKNHAKALGTAKEGYIELIKKFQDKIIVCALDAAKQMNSFYKLLSVDEASP